IVNLLQRNGFRIIESRGLLLPSALPIPQIQGLKLFNTAMSNSAIIRLCASVFIAARKDSSLTSTSENPNTQRKHHSVK
ncbi:MAG: hypothetical protein ACW98Y_14390, partial [Candidatus Thorarchaeota archaeon]